MGFMLAIALAGLYACVSTTDDRQRDALEPTGTTQQAIAACVAGIEGYGEPGRGWVGLRSDGSVWEGSPAQRIRSLGFDVKALADVDGEGVTHCALKNDQSLWCWGANEYGQLGDGTTIERPEPVELTALSAAVLMPAMSYTFGCALLADHTVWCWGDNEWGQLGDGTTNASLAPVRVVGLPSDVVELSAGFVHACARTATGNVLCWGGNTYGEIGNGTSSNTQPTPVSVFTGATKVSAGGFFTCAINAAGALYCWGDNADGHLGLGNTSDQSTPQHVSTLGNDVAHVDTGVRSTCAVRKSGAVWCWGWQDRGRLGNGTDGDVPSPLPTPVSGPLGTSGGASVHLTEANACAITTGSELWCWGVGAHLDGQQLSTVPVQVRFCDLPDLLELAPSAGPAAGGTTVQLDGTDFKSGAQVFFGLEPAASVTFVNAQTLRAVTPPHDPEVVNVRVVNPGNFTAQMREAFSFQAPPSVNSIAPTSGPTTGGTACTIEGAYFQQGATVAIGGAQATNVLVVDVATLTFTTGPGPAGLWDVVVTNPDGQTAALEQSYLYVGAPTPVSVEPREGPESGGTVVMITGTGFSFDTQITFGQSAAAVTFVDETTLSVETPPHAVGPVDVVASNEDGQTGTLAGGYTYVPDMSDGGVDGSEGDSGGPGEAPSATPALAEDETLGVWNCRASGSPRSGGGAAAFLLLLSLWAARKRPTRSRGLRGPAHRT